MIPSERADAGADVFASTYAYIHYIKRGEISPHVPLPLRGPVQARRSVISRFGEGGAPTRIGVGRRCIIIPRGLDLLVTREKENAPGLQFVEQCTWKSGQVDVSLDFWHDEAVLDYSIGYRARPRVIGMVSQATTLVQMRP
jgi:hypothetical protein